MPRVASSPHGAGSRSGSSTILISSRPSTSTFVLAKRFLGLGVSACTPMASSVAAAGAVSWPGSLPRVWPAMRLRGGISSERGRSGLHGARDLGIGAAATEIAAHRVAHLLDARSTLARKKRDCRHELARRAEAALQRVELDERPLEGMRILGGAEPLDGGDGLARAAGGEREATVRQQPFHEHSACTTLSSAAPEFRAGELEALAQHGQEGLMALKRQLVLLSIHGQSHCSASPLRLAGPATGRLPLSLG